MKREEEPTVSVKATLDEEDFNSIELAASKAMREWERGYVCQDINVRHHISWWIMKETEARIRSELLSTSKPEATEGGAYEKGWQPIDTLPLRALMAKLADLLDEDHFAACEEIVRRSGVAPPTADRLTGDLDDKTIVKLAREHFSEKDYDRLTYEKSPPMFPQATYDVPTYALSQFVNAIRAALNAKDPK